MEPTHTAHTPDGLLSHTTAGTHTQQKAGAKVRPSQPEERTAGDGEEDEELEELEEEEEVEEGEEALELDDEEEEGGGGGGGGAVDDGGPVGLEVPEETPGVEEEREQNQELGVEPVEPVEPVGPVKVATLDDMAKRIKVEEIAPASGLVSILKRRASLEEANSSRPAPNPKALPKRKVRFREPDDGFDQDEVGGDSWALLLLLCLATVVISVGGTALYCTVGDAQSSVCTDFSHNMDFYVQQVQRGMAELKHWFSPSS
ncbi:consortin [Clupea harengus]|uniref:Consortin n=1 Tax=Clupea harengus TaxID=7950 RepID=A0A6P8G9E0_CLUHA|nr:consortin [Clupea harengus]